MEPLFFVPFFEEKHWGGSNLASYFGKYPEGIRIGESWEVSPVQYRQTFVRSGEFAGNMVSELFKRNRELFGIDTPYFPFVIKILDVDSQCPVMIHGGGMKNDAGQTEGLYVIRAEEGSHIIAGTKLDNSLELFNAIAQETIMDSADVIETKKGDCFVVPAGVLHSIGAGHIIYEISSPLRESSQIYDWGRYSENNIESVLDSFKFGKTIGKAERKELLPGVTRLIRSELFSLDEIDATVEVKGKSSGVFNVYTALGRGVVTVEDSSYKYNSGDTFIITANTEEWTLTGGTLLKAYPPLQI
ncbi:MAG: class I mannose-6-phosphate isomerase [Clostridiales Family XIII bacterium]|jgi:mannose-6-phosphate isomerase|nr:class I mannose-6-phosphate isomerase [Clostridiales Family XIII bacterium]